ncbi:CubicO group peptidase (beta-lactamase class C family) [Nakamurella sp. UYEF19]|uniref:serine hydrolase n=1 Tax=Nakamurella sp. UYEF19 TaxID=1756392 RepID=UPI003390BAC4
MATNISGGLRELLESERAMCDVPGVAVAILRPDSAPEFLSFGSRDLAGQDPVTERTLFSIASCTKSFTAAAVASYVDEGLLEWDRPVRDYLPGFRLWDPVATEQLTLRDMLSHRSGLPRHDLLCHGDTQVDRGAVVRAMRHLQPNQGFRNAWQYNNLMYVAAGWVLEQVTGTTWEKAVQDRLLSPAEMAATFPASADTPKSADFTEGFARRRGQVQSIRHDPDDVRAPAGGIISCTADLARWLQANLDAERSNGATILSPAQFAQIHRPVIPVTPPAVEWPEITKVGYALGWEVIVYRGHRLLQHTGNVDGFSSAICFAPDDGFAVATLTNLSITPLRDIVPHLVLDELFGAEPAPWGTRFRDFYDAALTGELQAADRRHETAGTSAWPRPLTNYQGVYDHPAYGSVRVGVARGDLTVALRSIDLQVRHLHQEAFELRNDFPEMSIWARFDSDMEGHISSLALLLEPAVEPIVFTRRAQGPAGPELAGLAGSYLRGPLTAVLRLGDDSTLRLQFARQPAVKLVHRRHLVFVIEGSQNSTVEFVVDHVGSSTRLILWPFGDFLRVEADGPVGVIDREH